MKLKILTTFFAVILSASVVGCTSVSSRGFNEIHQTVEKRTGLHVYWNQEAEENEATEKTVSLALRRELTADEAVQTALQNNIALQATFEGLGIAQADLKEAGLLQNPVFEGSVRMPEEAGETNTEFSVRHNLLDLFILPLRKRLAGAQFEQAKLQVADAVLKLTAEVYTAYYTLQGSQQRLSLHQSVVQAAEAAAELSKRQHKAGNINPLDFTSHQAAFYEAKLMLMESETEVLEARENLSLLMGTLNPEEFEIQETLPELPGTELSLKELESMALSNRMDLAVAHQEMKVLKRSLRLSRLGFISTAEVGIETEEETDGSRLTGPIFGIDVPLFDRGQTKSARIKAQLRQGEYQLMAMEREIHSEVRLIYGRLLAARKAAEYYRDTVIPAHEEVVELSQKHYNFMLIGVYSLLKAKQEEIETRRNYIESLKNYWIARSELERAIGGALWL